MSRPEGVGMEMRDRIDRNFFDHSPDRRFIPGVWCKRTMTPGGNHDLGLPNLSLGASHERINDSKNANHAKARRAASQPHQTRILPAQSPEPVCRRRRIV
jgi:hypothetical protein